MKAVNVTLSTEGGKKHNILGKITVAVEFKNEMRNIIFYVCPDLVQSVYLGIDFFREFELAPELFKIEEIDIEKIAKEFPLEND